MVSNKGFEFRKLGVRICMWVSLDHKNDVSVPIQSVLLKAEKHHVTKLMPTKLPVAHFLFQVNSLTTLTYRFPH